MFTIGEFSKVTGLTVKTLRFYHEEGVLVPSAIDPRTGYRHYDSNQIETARAISYLRSLEFSIADIKQILTRGGGDEILDVLERQKSILNERAKRLRSAVRSLDQFISDERQASAMSLKTGGELNPKYPGGVENLSARLRAEGHVVIQKGNRHFVPDYQSAIA